MEISDKLWREYGFVVSSKYRTNVMKTLEDNIKIPSHIAEDSGILQNHISKILKELKEHGLVECINPEVRKGKLYRLTDSGSLIVKKLNE